MPGEVSGVQLEVLQHSHHGMGEIRPGGVEEQRIGPLASGFSAATQRPPGVQDPDSLTSSGGVLGPCCDCTTTALHRHSDRHTAAREAARTIVRQKQRICDQTA